MKQFVMKSLTCQIFAQTVGILTYFSYSMLPGRGGADFTMSSPAKMPLSVRLMWFVSYQIFPNKQILLLLPGADHLSNIWRDYRSFFSCHWLCMAYYKQVLNCIIFSQHKIWSVPPPPPPRGRRRVVSFFQAAFLLLTPFSFLMFEHYFD